VCNNAYNDKRNLLKHKLIHTSVCKKGFSQSSNVITH
jgi:hypothetical protein